MPKMKKHQIEWWKETGFGNRILMMTMSSKSAMFANA
jgi:hypothetical protein